MPSNNQVNDRYNPSGNMGVDFEEFMRKHCLEDDEEKQKIEKQLLQEDKKNVKNK